MSTNTHTTEWPKDDDGFMIPIDFDELRAVWARRTGAENIRRHWQYEGIADVLDLEWLRGNISEFDNDALVTLLVDCSSFSGDDDLHQHADLAAEEIWKRDELTEGLRSTTPDAS